MKNRIKEDVRQRLVDACIEQIKQDVADGDVEALDELLKLCSYNYLFAFLSDDRQQELKKFEDEIKEFKQNWGQSHSEICANLGYDNDCDDILMEDYFWVAEDKMWYNKCASMFTEREQEIADYLRHNS